MPINERHDTGELYNKLTIGELQQLVPHINWLEYFNAFMPVDVTSDEKIVCFSIDFVKQLGPLVNNTENRCLIIKFLQSLMYCVLTCINHKDCSASTPLKSENGAFRHGMLTYAKRKVYPIHNYLVFLIPK